MKDFFIDDQGPNLLLSLKASRYAFTQNEIVLVDFSPMISEENNALIIKNFSRETQKLYAKVEAKEKSLAQKTCLKWKDFAPKEYRIPPNDFFKHPWEKHLEDAGFPLRYLKEHPECRALELCLDEKNLEAFIPALMILKEAKLDFILLDTYELDLKTHAPVLKKAFDYLRSHWRHDLPMFFSPSNPLFEKWEAQTLNPFRGPRLVDIDLCNSCNHDCLFCGLHHPDLKNENLEFKKQKLSTQKALKLIEELPPSVEMVTLGGAGEPFLHPEIMTIIRRLREKNINVCVFTNFSVLNEEKIKELNSFVNDSPMNLWLIANISGANPQVYKETRPSQNIKSFFKLMFHLAYQFKYFVQKGPHFELTLMCVVNKLNYKNLPEFVALSKDVGAKNLWFKTMEPHGEVMKDLLLGPKEKDEEKKYKSWAFFAGKKLGVTFFEGDMGEGEAIPSQELQHYPLLKNYLEKKSPEEKKIFLFKRQRFTQKHFQKKLKFQENKTEMPSDTCFVAYDYLRLDVQGNAIPCCAMNENFGQYDEQGLLKLWHNEKLNELRGKIKTDSFSFCKLCPHAHINKRFNSLLS